MIGVYSNEKQLITNVDWTSMREITVHWIKASFAINMVHLAK